MTFTNQNRLSKRKAETNQAPARIPAKRLRTADVSFFFTSFTLNLHEANYQIKVLCISCHKDNRAKLDPLQFKIQKSPQDEAQSRPQRQAQNLRSRPVAAPAPPPLPENTQALKDVHGRRDLKNVLQVRPSPYLAGPHPISPYPTHAPNRIYR